MKIAFCFSAVILSLLGGCASNSAGSVGAVFHTSAGQHITAATAPEFRNGRYEFVDAAGARQSLYLSQVTSVTRR
jgi:hypothetical protein